MRNSDVLDRMIAGESVEASPDVRELAQLAALLQGAWQDGPSRAATNRTKAAALSAFEENGFGAATVPLQVVRPPRGRRIALRLAVAAALVLGLPVTAFAASADALPGQLMYPVKRGFEETRLALAGDPVDEGAVLLDLAGERVEEAVLAKVLGDPEALAGAMQGYEEAVARFDGRILEAQELGLPIDDLTARAEGLFSTYGRLLETLFGAPPSEAASEEVPPVPVEVSAAGGATEETPEAKKGGSGGHKNKNEGQNDRGGQGTDRNAGGNGGGGGGGSTTEGASGGGNCGNGIGQGGAAGAGQGTGLGNTCGDGTTGGGDNGEDAKGDDPPEPQDDDDEDDGDEGSGNGSGGGSEDRDDDDD